MTVSRQSNEVAAQPERGPRARTRRLMMETAKRLMQGGVTPSVSEVAEAAGVSRATAYRYFPSQAALVGAVVDEALGPILDWSSPLPGPAERVEDLFRTSLPRIDTFEATFRAALKLSLEQWGQRHAGSAGPEPEFRRGHRIELLRDALAPLRDRLGEQRADRLAQALSLFFGIELLIVLKDMWGMEAAEAEAVAVWAAGALVEAAMAEKAG